MFGKRQIIEYCGPFREKNTHLRHNVKVRCTCGAEDIVPYYGLRRGTSNNCKNCARRNTRCLHIGDRVGSATIIATNTTNSRVYGIAKCDCGKQFSTRLNTILQRKSVFCCSTCLSKNKKIGGILSRTFFNRIKRNAKIRNIPFEVIPEQLVCLFVKQNNECALSGLQISLGENKKRISASLDRIDSNKNYTINNVQWVHKDINKMKMDFKQNRFLELCKFVHENVRTKYD